MITRVFSIHITVICITSLALFGCSGESARKAASKVTGKTVETVKGVFTGVSEGVDEGRKQTVGTDGAIVLSTPQEMADKVDVSIYRLSETTSGNAEVTLALSNLLDQPVRISGLAHGHNMVMLDADSFAIALISRERDVTIPPKAKERATFVFNSPASKCKTFRLFGREVALPAVTVPPPATSSPADTVATETPPGS